MLAQLSADQVRVAVNDPETLGVLAEARLIGLERSDELARYLSASDVLSDQRLERGLIGSARHEPSLCEDSEQFHANIMAQATLQDSAGQRYT
jgi:hypothetical protein